MGVKYLEGEKQIDSGSIDLDSDTLTLRLLQSMPSDETETSVTTILASHSELTASGYSSKTVSCTLVKSGGEVQRRLSDQSWTNVTSGQNIAAVLVSKGDTPLIAFGVAAGPKVTNGGDVDLDFTNTSWTKD